MKRENEYKYCVADWICNYTKIFKLFSVQIISVTVADIIL